MKKTVKLVKVFENKILKNKKGDIIRFLNTNNKFFNKFGEIYFTEIKKNFTKGWNLHKKNTCIISVPHGSVEFKVYNPQKKRMFKIKIGKKNCKSIQIPPGNGFCFRSLAKISILANLMDDIHKKSETNKKNKINNLLIN